MSDWLAGLIIVAGVTLLALGVRVVVEVVIEHFAVKRSETKPLPVMIAEWPWDTLAPCESWVGRAMAAPIIAEAEAIIVRRWSELVAERVEEGRDD